MYIFISHSSKDAEMAQSLCDYMESKKNNCFLAPRDIQAGCEYAGEIAEGIDCSDVVLLILSNASNESPHVLREVERAVTRCIPILVYKIEEVVLTKSMEYFLMTHQWMNAEKNSYDDILKGIETLKNKSATKRALSCEINVERTTLPMESAASGKSRKKMITAVLVCGLIFIFGGTAIKVVSRANQGSENTMEKENAARDIRLGDTVLLGAYNDADIQWRVLKLSEDKTEAVLVASNVLTIKAYDAAESGKFNYNGSEDYYTEDSKADTDLELQAYVRGNSSWENSNIRTWLNSGEENVKYAGQAPVSSAMADKSNGYNAEPGFLCGFTEEELAAIKETRIETKGNALSETDTVVTKDKVFLLSMEELEWFKEADISLLAEPTDEAIEQDETYWYQDYCLGFGVEETMWWLREPVEGSSSLCYLVGNGYQEENIYTWEVGVESFGIRPAITVDLTKDCIRTETP